MAQFIAKSVVVPNPLAPFDVELGFVPGRIEIFNLSQASSVVASTVKKAVWQTGMSDDTALITQVFNGAPPAVDETVLIGSGGISLVNGIPPLSAYYAAVVSGFTNANPGVITVDATDRIGVVVGSIIRVASLADDSLGTQSLNGDYTVTAVTSTTITVNADTSMFSAYVSGGYVSVISRPNAVPPPVQLVVPVKNYAFYGFRIGSGCLVNAASGNVILVSAWDQMVVF